MSATGPCPDPDRLLAELRDAAGPPPLPPLRLAEPAASARIGPAAALVGAARRAVLRLIAPTLADLLGQLERDRARMRAEAAELRRELARLERRVEGRGGGGRSTGGG